MIGSGTGLAGMYAWSSPWVMLVAGGAYIWSGRLLMTTLRLWLAPVRRPTEMIAAGTSALLLAHLGWQLLSGVGLRSKGVYVFPGPDLRWVFLLPTVLAAGAAAIALARRLPRQDWLPPMIAAALYAGMLPAWDLPLPWPPAVMCAAIAGGAVFSAARVMTPDARGLPWRDSIKDAADYLGDGLAFFDSRGRPVQVNHRMTRILAGLGVTASSGDELWGAMADAGEVSHRELSDASAVTFRCGDEVYVAERNRVLGRRGRWYTEIRAIDVTDVALANRELMDDNERLRAAMAETRELLASIERIEKEQVLLDFRTRLHDVVAQRVSVVQRFLESGVDTPDRMATLGRMLTDVRTDIRSDHAAPRTLLRRVRQSFATAGVDIDVVGDLPANLAHAATAVRIIRQAATNAVAHGAATSVSAVFEETPGFWRLTVSNDGDLPERVTEGTGLSGVRATVEALGGSLGYVVNDVFSLVAEVPRADGPEPPAAGEPAGPAGTGGAGGDGCAGWGAGWGAG